MSTEQILLGISNLVGATVGAGLAVPLLRRRVPPNRLYGARFAKAFQSEALWYRINEFGARRLLFWSGVLAVVGVAAFLVPLEGHEARVVAFACAPLLLVLGALETYLYARRL